MGKLVAVCKSAERTDPKTPMEEGELRAGHGVVGDAHAGLNEREVSLLELEHIQRANRIFEIDARPGSFAENLTTEGVDLTSLHVGERLRVGSALLEVVQLGKPPELVHTYNYKGVSILPKWGVFCQVLEGGRVRSGDPVDVLLLDGAPGGSGS